MGIDVVVEVEGEEGDEVGLMKERRWKEEKEWGQIWVGGYCWVIIKCK